MDLKYTIQGLFIYATMALYAAALVLRLLRMRRSSVAAWALGFAAAAASVGWRWADAGHFPLANLFEVFLFMAMLMPAMSLFCGRVFGIEGFVEDISIAILFLIPAGFFIDAGAGRLSPLLKTPLFIPHVLAYMISYVVMIKAALRAAGQFFAGRRSQESAMEKSVSIDSNTCRLVCLGFPFLTAGLLLGAWWAKLAWGDFWNWDPKELWSLACWLAYVGYFHVRALYGNKYPKLNATVVVLGGVLIVITLLWVNLSKLFSGLHSYA